jgi:ketosteroid isomerase-like protein
MKRLVCLSMLILLTGNMTIKAQQPEDPAHAQLRILRDNLIDAMNKRDINRLLQQLHPDVVVTWQNSEVSRKPEGVRAYISKMLDGPNSIVESFTTAPTVDELTILYGGDAGVAFGSSRDSFKLRSGLTFELTSRWTATVVNDGGAWKIAAFHSSANLFDNPLLAAAQRWSVTAAVVALVAGFAIGLLVSRIARRRSGTA